MVHLVGCMIIVYDMLSDTKINLIHHQYEVYALAFSPPGSGNSSAGGDFLVSVDYNRNEANDEASASTSTLCLWNWCKGQCIQEVAVPKSQTTSFMFGQSAVRSGPSKHISLHFEKTGGLFYVLESSLIEFGGGYRISIWALGRHQRLEMVT